MQKVQKERAMKYGLNWEKAKILNVLHWSGFEKPLPQQKVRKQAVRVELV